MQQVAKLFFFLLSEVEQQQAQALPVAAASGKRHKKCV